MTRLRWWCAWLRWAAQTAGYAVRPYDMLADARRWRWRRPAPCGRAWWAELPPHARAEIIRAVARVERSE